MKISQEEWNKVLDKFQEKVDRIKELEQENTSLSNEIKNLSYLPKESAELARENIRLELENTKLNYDLNIKEKTLSSVLEKLHETFNMLENHGLMNRGTLKAQVLDLIV